MNSHVLPANGHTHLNLIFKNKPLPDNAHAGLVFSRFLQMWDGSSPDPAKSKETGKALAGFVAAYNRRGLNTSDACRLLSEIHERMNRFEEKGRVHALTFTVQWRLACGLGASHPLGNGFDFDPVIGVPMINGTAVKGLCRHTAKLMEHDEEELTKLFGPETIEPGVSDPAMGSVLFFDAFPVKWPKLAVDIVNCHHMDYYGSERKCHDDEKDRCSHSPKETETPNPVFFLAVDQGTSFVFRIGIRPVSKNGTQTKTDLKTVSQLLETGLTYFGIGAKTAAGYGVFQPV